MLVLGAEVAEERTSSLNFIDMCETQGRVEQLKPAAFSFLRVIVDAVMCHQIPPFRTKINYSPLLLALADSSPCISLWALPPAEKSPLVQGQSPSRTRPTSNDCQCRGIKGYPPRLNVGQLCRATQLQNPLPASLWNQLRFWLLLFQLACLPSLCHRYSP